MDKANYEKALQKEDDSTIVETKLTTDGVEFFSPMAIHSTKPMSIARKE